MKILVVYYSRTGTTRKVGNFLAEKLGADAEEIKDTMNRSGVKGYILSGRDAMKKRLTTLEPSRRDPAQYDLVIIGTPIWGWNVSSPVRTYVTQQKDTFKSVAFFCTMGGSGDDKAFAEMETIIGKKPIKTLTLLTRDVAKNNFEAQADNFVRSIQTA